MIENKIKQKDSFEIIKALEAGIVPRRGIGNLLVGRAKEVEEIISILENIKDGGSDIRFWVGDFGSGKSFILRTIESLALEKNFVVSMVDLTPNRRFHATDGKARALYEEIVDNLAIKTSMGKGNALNVIIDEWMDNLITKISLDKGIPKEDVFLDEYDKVIENKIMDVISSFDVSSLSFEFGKALCIYYRGIKNDDRLIKISATRWLRGNFETKTDSKRELSINKIINDDNWFDALKILSLLFRNIGYSGFVVNFDETVNLYKLPLSRTRERNYEIVLNIYNETKSNTAKGLFINLGATRKTIFDENRGMASYRALRGRMGDESSMDTKLTNTNRTVLALKPLSPEEIYTLLENLKSIYGVYSKEEINLSEDQIEFFMEEELNRPGAEEFLTPRGIIKDYLEILDLIRQNKDKSQREIILMKFKKEDMTLKKDEDNKDDDIEVF